MFKCKVLSGIQTIPYFYHYSSIPLSPFKLRGTWYSFKELIMLVNSFCALEISINTLDTVTEKILKYLFPKQRSYISVLNY